MSNVPAILNATEEDLQLLLSAQCHLGAKNATSVMSPYVYKRRNDGIHIINLGKTWEKLVLAARIIAAIENDIVVISARPYGHRAALKFAKYITRSFKEPRLIISTDPRSDFQAIKEASYVNIPVISLADTDSLLQFVDVAIPTNNKGKHALGLIYYLLTRTVLRLRGTLEYNQAWDVMVDMFFYRDPEEAEKEAAAAAAAAAEGETEFAAAQESEWAADIAAEGPAAIAGAADWTAETTAADWAEDANAQASSSWDA
ncbi:hypothetical protein K450DRAFT_232307 [Umbelopsis ramanniana AG]|uniref:Small ribosomal subunit protein uS2 n=1 Tax=Umbelopsis ramanniana AG TaxID=1314678 RepID=A0AAD5ED94_UMBRA|nr:uncharacterized protein K450DRAFT_232307 [Umbelopsis ramanniana AG]KAI8581287.1 hypothetical protein K450DRAFT_232307 [Umbelopsis ramanniana AG]